MGFLERIFAARYKNPREYREPGEIVFDTEVIVPLAGRIKPSRLRNLTALTSDFTSALGAECSDGSSFNSSPRTRDGRNLPCDARAGYTVAHATEHMAVVLSKVGQEGLASGLTRGNSRNPRRFRMTIRIEDKGDISPGTVARRARRALGFTNSVIGRD